MVKRNIQPHKNAFRSLIKLGYKPYAINNHGDLTLFYSDNISPETYFKNKGPQMENLIFKK